MDALASFLYELMRDHLPVGVVAGIVGNSPNIETVYTNQHLARYATGLADMLLEEEGTVLLRVGRTQWEMWNRGEVSSTDVLETADEL